MSPLRTLRRVLSWLALSAPLAPTGAQAAPDPAPSAFVAEQIAVLTVRVNEEERGEVPVVLRGGDVLVPAARLKDLWLERVASRGRRELVNGQEYVSMASLSPAISFEMDEQSLTLRLNSAPSLLPPTVVNLTPLAPAGIVYRSDTSLFLNYAPRLLDLHAADAYGEAGLSVGRALFWSAASYSTTHGAVRGLSSLTFDDRESMRRIVVGDAFSSGGALGGGFYAGGISISRNFDLDPYFVRGPTLGASTLAATPSQLEVYVNGVLVRQQRVAPGPVQIQNLQAQSGVGVAQYVLRDVFGREQALASPFYMSNGVLRAGVEEYTYTVGVRRDHLGLESFSYSAPVALARHRIGVSRNATVGGRFELGNGSVSAGGTLTWLLPYGLLDLAVGGSQAAAQTGGALAASYAYQAPRAGLGVLVQGMSPRYATISMTPADDRPLIQVNAFASLSLGRRVTVGAQHTIAHQRDAGLVGHASLLTNYQVVPGVSLLATLGRAVLGPGKLATDGLITLSFSIDRTNAQLSTHARSEGANEAIASVSRSLPRSTGVGYRATATYSDQAITRVQATGEYQGRHGVIGATYERDTLREDGQSINHLTLATRGAIVWVPGVGVFATRPVGQAIGILRVPGLAGVRGYLNNQEIGRTDSDGNLLLPDLVPYYANRVRLADEDLPLSYQIEGTEQLLAPPFRGAAVAQFQVKRALFFRGSVVVECAGADLVPAYGSLRVTTPTGVQESPIGKGGEIELEGLAPGEYPAEIVHETGTCQWMLRAPDARGPIVELGEMRCVIP